MRKVRELSQRWKRTKRKLFPTIQGGEKVRKKFLEGAVTTFRMFKNA